MAPPARPRAAKADLNHTLQSLTLFSSILALDVSEGSAEFIVDCEVCCRPMTVSVRIADGEIEGIDVVEA